MYPGCYVYGNDDYDIDDGGDVKEANSMNKLWIS